MKYRFNYLVLGLFIFSSFPKNLSGQIEIVMGEVDEVSTCNALFLDSGGRDGAYDNNEYNVVTICSDDPLDSHIKITFGSTIDIADGLVEMGQAPSVVDSLIFYDGRDTTAPVLLAWVDNLRGASSNLGAIIQATAANSSGCITVKFQSDGDFVEKGWEGFVECVASCQLVQAGLASSLPAVMPVDTGYIDVCPGQEVTFGGMGIFPQNGLFYPQSDETSTFEWNFGDGGSASGQEVRHTFRKSGGYLVQLTVTDIQGCTNTNFISQRVRVATKPDFDLAGDNQQVCVEDTISSQLLSLSTNEGSFSTGKAITDTLALPDGNGRCYTAGLTFSQFSPGQLLTNPTDIERICVNMEHTWMRDLEISLICPSGRQITLHQFVSQTGTEIVLGEPIEDLFELMPEVPGNGYEYCWTPNATNPTWIQFADETLNSKDTLPAGDYSPFESFSNLIGCPLNGEWTLEVCDLWFEDSGFVFEWGIDIDPNLFPEVETYTPEIVDFGFEAATTPIDQDQNSITTIANVAGTLEHTFFVQDDFGCTFDTTLNYNSLPVSHPDCLECTEDLVEASDSTICLGAIVQLDATPQLVPDAPEFAFEDLVRQDFGKNPWPQNDVFQSAINVTNVAPTQITDANNDIISICFTGRIDDNFPVTIEIEAPSGQTIVLVREADAITGEFSNICFTPAATNGLTGGTISGGEFQPADPWSDLNGATVNGAWNLNINSLNSEVSAGTISNWSITFQGQNNTTYQWTPSEGLSCDDCPNPIASPETSQQYIVEVSNDFGCFYRDTINITVDIQASSLEIESVETEPVACFNENNGSAQVNAFGGTGSYSFLWSDSLGQINQRAVFLEAGTYAVTVTDELGCRAVAEAIVTQPDSTLIDVAITDAQCRDGASGEISIVPSGGTGNYEASWSNGQSGLNLTGLLAGSYDVTVTDQNNCQSTETYTVTEPDDGVNTSISQTQQGCFGASGNELTVTAIGGTGPNYTYLWSDGQTTATATLLDTISYSVTVTDENGCPSSSSFTPADLANIEFNIIQTRPTCFDSTDGQLGVNNLSGGAGNTAADYNIQWSTGQTGDIIGNLAGGFSYSVTVTDNIGCESVRERVLDQPVMIDFTVELTDVSCFGLADGEATVRDIRGDATIFDFQWSDSAGGQNTATAGNLSEGVYSITVTDDRGCSSQQEVSISQPEDINLTFTNTDIDCFGEASGEVAVNITGGVPGYQAVWSNGAISNELTGLNAGSYQVSVTDVNGCMVEGETTIAQPDPVDIDLLGVDPTCFGDRNGQVMVMAVGGTAPFEYSIDGVNFAPSSTLIGLEAGSYEVTVRDAGNCLYSNQVELDNPAEFSVSAGRSDLTIILGDSIELSASTANAQGEVEFFWEGQYAGTIVCDSCQTTLARPVYSINYQLTGIDSRGCRATDMLRVFVEKLKAVNVPTGFTPNNDNANDLLIVHGRPGTMVSKFQVWNRWGELLYETGDFEVNSSTHGWDGTFRGTPSNSDTYIWYLEVEYPDGTNEIFRGQTNLIR